MFVFTLLAENLPVVVFRYTRGRSAAWVDVTFNLAY
jgi:hypothetical protein